MSQNLRQRCSPRGAPAILVLLLLVAAGCVPEGGPAADTDARATLDGEPTLFTEVTEQLGLGTLQGSWPEGSYAIPEIMGPGVGLFDYDGDGDLDILQMRFPPPDRYDTPAPDRLLRQNDDGSFEDVSSASGLVDPGYGQGVAIGDMDNDGDPDVYTCNFGPDRLYRNNGDGTFEDVTAAAGIVDDTWTSAATFCDYDRDGDLDLYVARYLRYDREHRGQCGLPYEDYCGPSMFDGVPDTLYRNDGAGRFSDVTDAAGIRLPAGGRAAKGLGTVCLDLSGDGWPDIFVANDGEANQLWVNQGDGSFVEEGIMRGVAVNRTGAPEASMGVAVGDVDQDGSLDLFLTHLTRETNTLYLGSRSGLFSDRTVEAGLAGIGLGETGFGCGLFDYDHDGDLDLALVNGRVARGQAWPQAERGEFWNLYAEPHFLLENDGSGRFVDRSDRAGTFASEIELRRGLAFGDLDDDGDVDLVTSTGDDRIRVFRNDSPKAGHWIRLRLRTRNRDALGARVVLTAGDRQSVGLVLPGSSYQSSSDPRVHVGLGDQATVESVEVLWPDGAIERFGPLDGDREWTLEQGTGGER